VREGEVVRVREASSELSLFSNSGHTEYLGRAGMNIIKSLRSRIKAKNTVSFLQARHRNAIVCFCYVAFFPSLLFVSFFSSHGPRDVCELLQCAGTQR